jgi:hypothetical protein
MYLDSATRAIDLDGASINSQLGRRWESEGECKARVRRFALVWLAYGCSRDYLVDSDLRSS